MTVDCVSLCAVGACRGVSFIRWGETKENHYTDVISIGHTHAKTNRQVKNRRENRNKNWLAFRYQSRREALMRRRADSRLACLFSLAKFPPSSLTLPRLPFDTTAVSLLLSTVRLSRLPTKKRTSFYNCNCIHSIRRSPSKGQHLSSTWVFFLVFFFFSFLW